MARDTQTVSIVYVRALQKAANVLGDRKKLARHLRVKVTQLESWLAGNEAPPIEIFLRTVALILDESAPHTEVEAPRAGECANEEDSDRPA
jgi:hypothetical protein